MAENISKLTLNGTTYEIQDKQLSEQVATLQGEVANKLDVTAYTPYDDAQVKADIQNNKTAIEGKQDKGNYALSGTSYTKAESDAKYLTEHQSLADYAKTADVNTELAKKQDKGDYVSATTLNEYAKKTDIPNTSEFITSAYTYDKTEIDTSLGNKADKKHEHDIDDITYRKDYLELYNYSGENVKYNWKFYDGIFYFATSAMDWDILKQNNVFITLYFDSNKTEYVKLEPYEEVGYLFWKVTDYNYQYFDSSEPYFAGDAEGSGTEIRFTNYSGTIYYVKVENYEGKIGYISISHADLSSKFNEVKNSLTNLIDEKANSTDVYTKEEIDNMVGNINNALNLI